LLIRHWRQGALGAGLTGMRHGIFCLGCCWLLMALLFVGGLMNFAWVAAIALRLSTTPGLPCGQTGPSCAALRQTRGGRSALRGVFPLTTGTSLFQRPRGVPIGCRSGVPFQCRLTAPDRAAIGVK
jgi:hypothetical protein